MHGQMVPYLNERFPTEIRATASAFCYHQAAIFGGLVPLVLTYFAEHFGTGLSALFVSIPLRPQNLHFLGTAYLLAGKYETAAALLRDRILLVPGTDFSRVLLASALGHLGEGDEARRIWQELEQINPKYSFSEHFARQPFKKEEDVQRIAEGLAKAGLST